MTVDKGRRHCPPCDVTWLDSEGVACWSCGGRGRDGWPPMNYGRSPNLEIPSTHIAGSIDEAEDNDFMDFATGVSL